jgi:predicted ATPase/DNA-binding CsgD family transcriptional regulator
VVVTTRKGRNQSGLGIIIQMNLNKDTTQVWIEPFSPRELEILQLIFDGLSNREIAKRLYLAIDTVKWYNKQLYIKLGVRNRTQAAKKAVELKLLESDQIYLTAGKEHAAGNLPAQISTYVGRKKEIKEIKDLLKTNRLVVLTGAGGSGKTRLALQVAEELQGSYPDGIWLVELANIREASLVTQTIATVLGIAEKTNTALIEIMKQNLNGKRLLLLLDNLEHLLDSAPLVSELLAAAPQLSVLGTSREHLHIYGEQEYPLQPLSLPDPNNSGNAEELRKVEAVALFIQRAQAVNPNLSLDEEALQHLARICIRLDGLPLAIELCAPMVKIFPLRVIAERIENNLDSIPEGPRDLPARQQTLIKTLQWSRDLLSEDEKRLFERLAIFSGGGTLEAIESICANGISGNIGNLLSALVHKNLVLARERLDGQIHFLLLETIRQYNRDRLKNQGQFEILSKLHAEYYTHLAQRTAPKLSDADQVRSLDMLEVEHDNLRSALKWCQTTEGAAELGLNLAGSLELFWAVRGYFQEGREHLSTALSRQGVLGRTESRAKALHAEAHLAYMQGDYPLVRERLEESLSIYRALGSEGKRGKATVLITLGDKQTEVGEYESATKLMKEALEIMHELQDTKGIARALWQLGACEVRRGNYVPAREYFEDALQLLRQIGDNSNTAIALSGLAEIAIRQENYEHAAVLEDESLAMRKQMDEPWGIGVSLGNFAWIALRKDNLQEAESYLKKSLTLRRDIADRGGCAWCLEKLAESSLALGLRESSKNPLKHYCRAAKLFGAAEAMRELVDSKIDLVDLAEYERKVGVLRSQLDENTFTVSWSGGHSLTMEQSVDFALGDGLD